MNSPFNRSSLLAVLAFMLFSVARAAPEIPGPPILRLEDLPRAAQAAIRPEINGALIRHISLTPMSYTARIDRQGQKSEVRVAATGQLLRPRSKQEAEARFEEEQRLNQAGHLKTVPLASVAPAARDLITTQARDAHIDQIVQSPAVYTITFERKGTMGELRVTDDGKMLTEPQP